MRFVLGIDIGGTCTSAAVSRLAGDTWTGPEAVRLSPKSYAAPSVLHMSSSGALTIGEPDPDEEVDESRIIRGFTRRIGDDVPLMVGGEPCPAHGLTAVLAMWVVEHVMGQEGAQPDQIALCHPASWGPYRKEILLDALLDIGLTNVRLLPRPVAAAESHAARGFSGDALAVYALGGSSFEASVVRRADPAGFRLVGWPLTLDTLGGADFDEALFQLVRGKLSQKLALLDEAQVRVVLAGLRGECGKAKERLSATSETDLLVPLPHGPARVSVTRTEFEDSIRPTIQVTVDELGRAVRASDVPPDQLDGVLLVGGSSQIPLVAQLLTAYLPSKTTVAVDVEPQFAAAKGAALAAAALVSTAAGPRSERLRMARSRPARSRAGRTTESDLSSAPSQDIEKLAPPPRPPVTVRPLHLPTPRASRLTGNRSLMIVGVAVLAIVLGVMTFFFGSDGTRRAAPANTFDHRQTTDRTAAAATPDRVPPHPSGWSRHS